MNRIIKYHGFRHSFVSFHFQCLFIQGGEKTQIDDSFVLLVGLPRVFDSLLEETDVGEQIWY